MSTDTEAETIRWSTENVFATIVITLICSYLADAFIHRDSQVKHKGATNVSLTYELDNSESVLWYVTVFSYM